MMLRQLFAAETSICSCLSGCRLTCLTGPVVSEISLSTKLQENLNFKLIYTQRTHVHADALDYLGRDWRGNTLAKAALIKPFDRFRTNGSGVISSLASTLDVLKRALSNHERNQFVQRFSQGKQEIAKNAQPDGGRLRNEGIASPQGLKPAAPRFIDRTLPGLRNYSHAVLGVSLCC